MPTCSIVARATVHGDEAMMCRRSSRRKHIAIWNADDGNSSRMFAM